MTKLELVRELEENEEIRSIIKQTMELHTKIDTTPVPGYRYGVDRFKDLYAHIVVIGNRIAKLYLTNYFKDGRKTSYEYFVDSGTRQNLINSIASHVSDEMESNIYRSVKDSALKDIVTPYVFRQERERRNSMAFDENAQAVKLDMFSLKLFENYVLKRKRKLSGKDCMKYLRIIPTATTNSESKIRTKFIKILWGNTSTKSLAFIDALYWENYIGDISDIDKPFVQISQLSAEQVTHNPYATISTTQIRKIARQLSLALNITSRGISESALYSYVTNVTRKSAMTQSDAYYAIDKLVILEYLQDQTPKCAYFKMLIDQLKSELNREENNKILATVFVKSPIIQAQLKVDTYLKQITKEQ